MVRIVVASLAPAALILGLGLAAPASAAQPDSAPVATDPTADQISAWITEGGATTAQPLTIAPDEAQGFAAERRIHGEVGVNVGNRGYGGYAAAQVPIGQASELDLAVGAQRYDYGRWGKGTAKSLSIALFLDGDDLKNLISRRHCNVPRWGTRLKDDPLVLPDGSCLKLDPEKTAEATRRWDAATSARNEGPTFRP